MIGMVLITHGKLGAEMLAALEHVVGPQQQAMAISIGADDDIDKRRADLLAAIAACERGRGVVVLTDMFGGTPSNLAISVLGQAKVEVIAGVNLPMLIKLASVRAEHSLPAAIAEAQEAGRKYINVASALLNS